MSDRSIGTLEPSAPPAHAPPGLARRRLIGGARRLAVVMAVFAAWEIGARVADNRLLPPPVDVVVGLYQLVVGGELWFHGQLTFQRGVLGLAIAVVTGLAFGIALARSPLFRAAFEPLLAATYPVPKLALYPLLILILGFGGASKVTMVALECFYPIAYNTFSGVQHIDKRFFWLARNVEAPRSNRVSIMLRAATPSIMASMRMATPIMLVIMVVTELIGESRGLGFMIRQAGTDFQPARALAVILFLGVLGYVLDRLIVAATRRLAFWARGVDL